MMVGGSPCQDFSVAGKQEGAKWTCKDCGYEYNPLEAHYITRDKCPKCKSINIEKTRSSLLVEWLRILREKKPNLAIYENVKNIVGKKFKQTFDLFINELHEYGYNTYYKVLNAKDYGVPQNRERVYLIIIKKEIDNGEFKFPKGFDNGIRLKDVLEKEVNEKYYISQEKTDKLIEQLKNKEISNTIRSGGRGSLDRHQWDLVCVDGEPKIVQKCGDRGTNNYSVKEISNTIPANPMSDRGQLLLEPKIICEGNIYPSGGQNGNIYNTDGIAPTLRSGQGIVGNGIGSNNAPKILEENKVIQVGNIVDTGNWDNPQRGRIYSPDGCSPSLNCCGGGGLEPKILEENELKFVGGIDTTDKWIDNEKEFSRNYKEGYRVYDSEGIACCQKSNGGGVGSYTGLYAVKGCSTRTRNYKGQPEQLEVRNDELSNSVTTVQKDSMALEIVSTNKPIRKYNINNGGQGERVYDEEGISVALSSNHNGRDVLVESPVPELVGGIGEINFGKQYRQGNRVYSSDKTAMCLLSQPVGNTGGSSYLYLVKEGEELKDSFIEKKYKEFINKYGYIPDMFNPYNCSEITDISPTTTTQCGSTTSSATVLIKDLWYRIRKLIPLECFRLMGFSDKDFYILKENGISDSQCYKMAGNSIVVDVLYYIYLEIYKAMPYLFNDVKLGSFFSGIGAFEKALFRLQENIDSVTQ